MTGIGKYLDRLPRWRDLDLIKQFALASFFVISLGMFVMGYWISAQIRDGVIQHTATTTALYMEGFVEPLSQRLESQRVFDAEVNKVFDENLKSGPLKGELVALKIWNRDGTIAYSNFPELIGQKFPIDESLSKALSGVLSAELGETDATENVKERQLNVPLYEVYSPLHQRNTGEIIGVGEFYLRADDLIAELRYKTIKTWFVVGLLTLATTAILSAIMLKASRTIGEQRGLLSNRVAELSSLLADNRILSGKIEKANEKAVELNDEFLSQIGADLHDGPAQLVSYGLLRLHANGDAGAGKHADEQSGRDVQKALRDALTDIRLISSGLVLPQLEDLSLADSITLAANYHQQLTGSNVLINVELSNTSAPKVVKSCAYRVVQESLTNAFKHAGGIGQSVSARVEDNDLVIDVSDRGPGFDWSFSGNTGGHLGLVGLQNRVQTLGGTLTVGRAGAEGSRILVRIPLTLGRQFHG
jgi:signal transduction histidine kinase